ncbi:MAG TPA: GAF and ANTAR domain-containing protein [Acidimicrobiales bacterium]|nr:GAF and ANTAR domain-containing protein [Acidimicrobiales bacterium]
MIGDSQALDASLGRLRALAPEGVDVECLLREFMAAVELLFGLSGAGVMLVDDEHVLRSVVTTDERGAALEAAQQEAGTGPCLEGFVYDRAVPTSDIHRDERFKAVSDLLAPSQSLSEGARGSGGVCAVLGVPIRLGGGPVGVLNVYVDEPHEWTDGEIHGLSAYADLLGTLLGTAMAAHRNDALARQLQYALDHRVVIERAVGYLMGAGGLGATDAFEKLRLAARCSRRKVGDVAAALLDHGTLD